jgi:hypothetical protein
MPLGAGAQLGWAFVENSFCRSALELGEERGWSGCCCPPVVHSAAPPLSLVGLAAPVEPALAVPT